MQRVSMGPCNGCLLSPSCLSLLTLLTPYPFLSLLFYNLVLCLVPQLCPALCTPMDCTPPGSSVHGDSLGKNTGVGCHALLQGTFSTQDGACVSHVSCIGRQILYHQRHLGSPSLGLVLCCAQLLSCVRLCATPPGSSVHGDSPGKNTGVGCHALFQRIFPTQGSNSGLLHCWQIIYQLRHQGNPTPPYLMNYLTLTITPSKQCSWGF